MYGHLNDRCTEKYFCSGWMTTDRRADLLNWGFSVIHIFSLHTELHKAFEHTSDLTPVITTLWCFCSEPRQTKVRVARFTAAEALRHAQSSVYKQDVCLDYFKEKHGSTEMRYDDFTAFDQSTTRWPYSGVVRLTSEGCECCSTGSTSFSSNPWLTQSSYRPLPPG